MSSLAELSPYDSYVLAEVQKDQAAKIFLHQIIGIYQDAKAGKFSASIKRPTRRGGRLNIEAQQVAVAKQNEAIAALVAETDKRLERILKSDETVPYQIALERAIRKAYREVAPAFGTKQVDPQSPNFEADLKEFHRNYVTNFPIPSEQETLPGFRALLTAPTRNNGYKEVAFSVVCPFTGKFLMGTNFTIQPESNSAHFIYGFVMPDARDKIGLSQPLIEALRNVANQHIAKYAVDYPNGYSKEPLISFEKNILADMPLSAILMDTAGIDIENPPKAGANLEKSSIGQSLRDMIWSMRGGKVVSYNYMQSSLDGVVKIANPEDEQLVIRMLNKDAKLTEDESRCADMLLNKALGKKVEGCTELNLCIFSSDNKVFGAQVRHAMDIFQGTSVVKDPEGIKDDIYFKASMADLDAKTAKDGTLRLVPIPVFGDPVSGVKSFQDAELLTKVLLANTTWDELRANAGKPYQEWLTDKLAVLEPQFAAAKKAARRALPAPQRKAAPVNGNQTKTYAA